MVGQPLGKKRGITCQTRKSHCYAVGANLVVQITMRRACDVGCALYEACRVRGHVTISTPIQACALPQMLSRCVVGGVLQ